MTPVFLISPFSGERAKNIDYALEAVRDCMVRFEAPFGGHLLYPQVLDDDDPVDRRKGMLAGQAWIRVCGYAVVYVDRGISKGMLDDIRFCQQIKKEFFVRSIDPANDQEFISTKRREIQTTLYEDNL